jgi:hypothetical protein
MQDREKDSQRLDFLACLEGTLEHRIGARGVISIQFPFVMRVTGADVREVIDRAMEVADRIAPRQESRPSSDGSP